MRRMLSLLLAMPLLLAGCCNDLCCDTCVPPDPCAPCPSPCAVPVAPAAPTNLPAPAPAPRAGPSVPSTQGQ